MGGRVGGQATYWEGARRTGKNLDRSIKTVFVPFIRARLDFLRVVYRCANVYLI